MKKHFLALLLTTLTFTNSFAGNGERELHIRVLQLNLALEDIMSTNQAQSASLLLAIGEKVAERGNKPSEVILLEEAKKLHKISLEMSEHLAFLKERMISYTGGFLEDGRTPMGLSNTDVSTVMFIGDKGYTQIGKELEFKLDTYIKEINRLYYNLDLNIGSRSPDANYYPSMTLDGNEDPMYMRESDCRNKSFLELKFKDTPMIYAYAYLTELQSKIITYEKEILGKQQEMVGASDFKFDKLIPIVLAESNIVAAGSKFNAKIFLSATSSSIKPTMKCGGKDLVVDAEGKGSFEFKVSVPHGVKPDKSGKYLVRKNVEITVPIPSGGGDTTLVVPFEYYVVKPTIQIESSTNSVLYSNCMNQLNVQVPSLGDDYNPNFNIGEANCRVVKGKEKGSVTLIPTTSTGVTLVVNSNGMMIGSQEFKVMPTPTPTIKIKYNGKEINQKTGMAAPGPGSLEIETIADAGFASILPKEAKYKAIKWEATLVRGKRAIAKKVFMDTKGDLSAFAASAQAGDRILIEILDVRRKKASGGTETIQMGTQVFNIPLTD